MFSLNYLQEKLILLSLFAFSKEGSRFVLGLPCGADCVRLVSLLRGILLAKMAHRETTQ